MAQIWRNACFWKNGIIAAVRNYFAQITVLRVPLQRRMLKWSFLSITYNRVLGKKGLCTTKHSFIYMATKAKQTLHAHTATMHDVMAGTHKKLTFSPTQTFHGVCDMLSHTFPHLCSRFLLFCTPYTPPSPWPSLFISQSVSHAPEHADSALLQGCIYQDDKALWDNSQVSQG